MVKWFIAITFIITSFSKGRRIYSVPLLNWYSVPYIIILYLRLWYCSLNATVSGSHVAEIVMFTINALIYFIQFCSAKRATEPDCFRKGHFPPSMFIIQHNLLLHKRKYKKRPVKTVRRGSQRDAFISTELMAGQVQTCQAIQEMLAVCFVPIHRCELLTR